MELVEPVAEVEEVVEEPVEEVEEAVSEPVPEGVQANKRGRQNIHNRNQMLAGTQAYNLKLEQHPIQSRISEFAAPLQKAMAHHHLGDLDRRIHKLASSGLP